MSTDDPTPVSTPGSPSRFWTAAVRIIVAVVVAVVAIVAIGVGLASERVAAVKPTTFAGPARAVVIGDSIMDGHGLGSLSQAWPELVAAHEHWTLTNLAQDGAGFVQKGNANTVFADQVNQAIKLKPDIVLLSGSSNDLGIPEAQVEAAIDSAVAKLHEKLPHAELLATTPVWNEQTSPAQLDQIDRAMQRAIAQAGGTYLNIGYPLLGHPSYMQSDDVHPNPQGQIAIANAVEAALKKARPGD